MNKPRIVFYSVIVSGLFCAWVVPSTGLKDYAFPLAVIWMIVGNIAAYSLRCRHCQKQLIKSKDGFFIRGWGWDKCDFCGKDQ